MKIVIAYFIILLISLSEAIAQTDFREGYLISLEKDTIYGQVDYRPNSNENETMRLRQGEMITEYLPEQISGFGYLNDVYYTSLVANHLFAEVLVSGELSLYKYKDAFLMGKTEGKIFWLHEQKDVQEVDGKHFLLEDNKWRGIITYMIFDCMTNAGNIAKNIQFNEKELVNIAVDYNSCKGSPYIYYKEIRPVFKVDYGLAIGVTKSFVHSKDVMSLSKSVVLSESYTSIDPTFGLAVAFSSPRINERFAIQSGIHFSNMNYSGLVKFSGNNTEKTHYSFIGLTSFSFPLALKYTVPKGINSIFAQGGIVVDYHIRTKASYFYEDIFDNVVYINPEREAFEISKIQRKILMGAGVDRSFKRFNGSVVLNYSPPFYHWINKKGVNNNGYIHSIHNNRINLSIIVSRK